MVCRILLCLGINAGGNKSGLAEGGSKMVVTEYDVVCGDVGLILHDIGKYWIETDNAKQVFNSLSNIDKFCRESLWLHKRSEENVYVLMFNSALNLLGVSLVSRGIVNNAVVSPREVLYRALLSGASAIILVHNHPSGDIVPSKQDMSVTERMLKACDLIGITLLDHLIIGDSYYSFKQNNWVKAG